MNTAIHIKAPSALTQAHRDTMAYIQDLAITITQQGTYAVSAEYSGHVHEFSVDVLLFSDVASGNFKARTAHRARLPGRVPYIGETALSELQAIARELEELLVVTQGGVA